MLRGTLSMRRLALPSLTLVGLCLIGCNRFEPAEYSAFDPPAQYRVWWDSTEACSGRTGNFNRVHWFVVPGPDFKCPTGRCSGRWEPEHRIYLAEGWKEHEMVVRHEMLHELIGHAGHPNPPFGIGCPLTWSTWNQAHGAGSDLPGSPIDESAAP